MRFCGIGRHHLKLTESVVPRSRRFQQHPDAPWPGKHDIPTQVIPTQEKAGDRHTERKLAVVPRVVVAGMLGEKDYGVLLTDRRMIFVLERTSRAGIAAGIGGIAGAMIASEMAEKREFVYADADPEALSNIEGTIVIPANSIRSVRVKRGINGVSYSIRIDHTGEDGKDKKLNGLLSPPENLLDRRKSEGVKFKVILEEYAKKAQDAFKMVLPLGVRDSSEWL